MESDDSVPATPTASGMGAVPSRAEDDVPAPARSESVEDPSTATESMIPRSEPPFVDSAPAWGLSRSDRSLLLALSGLVLVLGGWRLARMQFQGGAIDIDRPPHRKLEYRIEINSATWVEWMQLPEIGETTARKIIADREARGPFVSIDDVSRVPGIGPKTMEAIRPHLYRDDHSPSLD